MNYRSFLLWLRTLRYLKPSQIAYYLLRRALPARSVKVKSLPIVRSGVSAANPIAVYNIYKSDFKFNFLNVSKDFTNKVICWQPKDMSRLWQYHLHYFDYLREFDRPVENKIALISNWIVSNVQSSQPGWEPFTVSLRIVNWIFFIHTEMKDIEIPSAWNESLYEQAAWLGKNDEKHILANHYFENIKALIFAGVYFDDKRANKWLKKAELKLREQLSEQFLDDGGHYERSPQYHCLMLENCLDLYNLFANNRAICDMQIKDHLQYQCERSLHWLAEIQYHDGNFPLFNDSANGIAPTCDDLYQYANRLYRYEPEANIVSGGKIISLDESGYYGVEANSDKFIIDCGEVGPSYQSGHTHCDFLSYELMFDNQLVIVDSGVYEYQEGNMRDYVRSTQAHNTVSVDGTQQTELWAAFRVARRAQKLNASIRKNPDGAIFNGAYSGFYGVGDEVIHEREANIILDDRASKIGRITINDVVKCAGQHKAESFIHLHPDIECRDQEEGIVELFHHNDLIARVIMSKELNYKISTSYYCPELGKKFENPMIVIDKSGASVIKINYVIEKI